MLRRDLDFSLDSVKKDASNKYTNVTPAVTLSDFPIIRQINFKILPRNYFNWEVVYSIHEYTYTTYKGGSISNLVHILREDGIDFFICAVLKNPSY